MNGYERTTDTLSELSDALFIALEANPQQRLGQLLVNLAERLLPDEETATTRFLWNIHDEQWVDLLRAEAFQ